MSKTPWHGLTYDQWIKLWDHAGWRAKVGRALSEVARDRRASAHDRLMCLQTINEAISNGALPADPGYPELMRDVLLDVVTGGARVSVWTRRHRKRQNARLIGARWMLQTAYQFFHLKAAAEDTNPDAPAMHMLS